MTPKNIMPDAMTGDKRMLLEWPKNTRKRNERGFEVVADVNISKMTFENQDEFP